MSTAKDNRLAVDYLLQRDRITDFIPSIGKVTWQVVYAIDDEYPDTFAVFSALLELEAVKKALEKDSWDLHIGDGLPGFSRSGQKAKETTTYHRFGTEGIRPLVVVREFHGAWPSYIELCEEFRHFHNLAEDHENQCLLDFDESGYKVEVNKISEHRVDINFVYLRRFLAATQLYLAIYFDSVRCSRIRLDDVPESQRVVEYRDTLSRYSLHVATCGFHKEFLTSSRLLGKVIISPPPIHECGKRPFDIEQEVSYIIGVNPDGTLIEHTSNPDKLANYFGANPGALQYVTPVYFRREVLQKYYAEPERYSVEDGYLRCLGLWGMHIDNSHPTHVVAFLGDLGRDLPYRERLHWKAHNVPPPHDAGISETSFRRSFLAQFAEPSSVDLIFRNEYQELKNAWRDKFGWSLFLDPAHEDKHILTIHIPTTESERELEEQILWLTKLLVDSLNEAELVKGLPKVENEKGIGKFERFLESKKCPHTKEIVGFLRDIQRLRSTSAAHRKSRDYRETMKRLGLTGKSGPEVMKILLNQAVGILRRLRKFMNESEV
jgi:hypothetical protein